MHVKKERKKERKKEHIRLPWRGQCGRAAAGCAHAAAALRCAATALAMAPNCGA
jgi:hypothetical protein